MENGIISLCCRYKWKMEAQAFSLNPFTVCSSCNRKIVLYPFVDEETNRSYSFVNGLRGLAHLYIHIYIYTFLCICIYIYIYKYMFKCKYICKHLLPFKRNRKHRQLSFIRLPFAHLANGSLSFFLFVDKETNGSYSFANGLCKWTKLI